MVYRIEYDNDKKTPPQQGYWQEVTLRDYFAAKALGGCMQHWEKMMTDEESKRLAKWCYRWADAMLKSRTEQKGE